MNTILKKTFLSLSLLFVSNNFFGQNLIANKKIAKEISQVILLSNKHYDKKYLKQLRMSLCNDNWIVSDKNDTVILKIRAKDCLIIGNLSDNWLLDKNSATQIAKIIFKYKYGKRILKFNFPFTSRLSEGKWLINGTLPKGYIGGVPYIIIQANNSQILQMWHTK
jgi:hypothetical protein